MGHRQGFDPDTGNAHLPAFDNRRTSSAEWIKNDFPIFDPEIFQVTTDQVGWERQHKAIPSMCRAVIILQLVGNPILVDYRGFIAYRFRCSCHFFISRF